MLNLDYLEDIIRSRRNDLERRKEQIVQDSEEQDILESMLQQYVKQARQLEAVTLERDALKAENEQLKMEKSELGKMSQKLVEKTEHDDPIKVLRKYMNISKRKNVKKRGYIKAVILEMSQSAGLTLPEDMIAELEIFDDDNTSDRPTIGEYVAVKNVENEIQNVEANGTGIVKHLNAGNDGY